MIRMDAARRAALIKELFAADGANIGVSYLRVSIGASDLNDHVFSGFPSLIPGADADLATHR
jgi:glucosylceramidase